MITAHLNDMAGEVKVKTEIESPSVGKAENEIFSDELSHSVFVQAHGLMQRLVSVTHANYQDHLTSLSDTRENELHRPLVYDKVGDWRPLTPESDVSLETDPGLVSPDSETPGFLGCAGCCMPICERYVLLMNGLLWHENCLRCCECGAELVLHGKCYVKNGQIYCTHHYNEMYGPHCASCDRVVAPSDWVRHVGDHVYHVKCFTCCVCARLLDSGDHIVLVNSGVSCASHCMVQSPEISDIVMASSPDETAVEAETKVTKTVLHQRVRIPGMDIQKCNMRNRRSRTTFTQEQLDALQDAFNRHTNPVGRTLQAIAQSVGLSRRVTQVWFQNARARHRRR